jgi:hypothetical protein
VRRGREAVAGERIAIWLYNRPNKQNALYQGLVTAVMLA